MVSQPTSFRSTDRFQYRHADTESDLLHAEGSGLARETRLVAGDLVPEIKSSTGGGISGG